ncbi:hypothetical protein O0L34_g4846 [Tuta absoluta]|nr:hypothetical protein O0L34_g4846 [Tuta absoluta]
MDLTWSANWPAFNYDIHIAPQSMAKDLARERWSPDFFKLLKKFHQTHYEQMGFLSGSIFVDGKAHVVNMPCVRDHSFGKRRDWRNFHRYALHFIYLTNGDCIAVGAVSQPVILSHITIGYYCRKSDQAVLPVKACDFQLWQHGENQTLPKDYGFTFKAGGERHDVRIQVKEEDFFYIGKTREAKIYERWASVEVNGLKGWGCTEWQYNNVPAAIKQ